MIQLLNESCTTCDAIVDVNDLTTVRALVLTKTGGTIAADIEICEECFDIVDGEPLAYSDYLSPTRTLRTHT